MEIIFLGTGSSSGVPKIGCFCPICSSQQLADKRTRASLAILTKSGHTILIDTSPDIKSQLINNRIKNVDAILFTHHHADHILGMYDITKQIRLNKDKVKIFCNKKTYEQIIEYLKLFHAEVQSFEFTIILSNNANNIYQENIEFENITIYPLPVYHGSEKILAFLVIDKNTNKRFAYITDCNNIPSIIKEKLQDIEILILGVLKDSRDPLHYGLRDLPFLMDEIKPQKVFVTHLSHTINLECVNSLKFDNVICSYDGLKINF